MKVTKAMKKLKFWSRKKKTKKNPFLTQQQQPPSSSSESSYHYYHHHHNHCHYYPVEPSAPPLPSWLDYNRTPETISDHFASTTTTTTTTCTVKEDEEAPLSSKEEINGKNNITSYQQYMVENPVYGVPALPHPQVSTQRNSGAFGCVFSIGAHLLRCFFPCFHIREAINK